MSDLRNLRDRPIMELLQAMEQRMSGTGRQVLVQRDSWAGVAVSLDAQRILVPQDQVREVVEMPPYSRVPGAKPWLIGVANIRGELVPIISLKGILMDAPAAVDLNSRILVLKHDEIPAGFLVDRVEGLRRFDAGQQKASDADELPPACNAFVTGSFTDGTNNWPVLSLHSLVEDPVFQMAA